MGGGGSDTEEFEPFPHLVRAPAGEQLVAREEGLCLQGSRL